MTGRVVLRVQVSPRQLRIIIGGHLHGGNAHLLPKVLVAALRCYRAGMLTIDAGGLKSIDAIGVAALDVCWHHARRCRLALRIIRLSTLARQVIAACEQHQLLAAPGGWLRGAFVLYACTGARKCPLPATRSRAGVRRTLRRWDCHRSAFGHQP